MGKGAAEKPPTGSLYPRESYVCFFIFLVELASVPKLFMNKKCHFMSNRKLLPLTIFLYSALFEAPKGTQGARRHASVHLCNIQLYFLLA